MTDSLSGAARAGSGVLVLFGCLCGVAAAQPMVDGDLSGDASIYGAALSMQTANSGFGNATNGDQRFANGGSEIDQVFGYVSGSRLHVLITGNLESNFNKLNVFIDSQAGGVNQINGNNLPAMVDPFCCGNPPTDVGALQRMNGLSFDSGFTADHLLIFSNGVESVGTSSTYSISSYYADLTQGAAGDKSEIGFHRFARGMEPGLAQGEPIDQLNNACTGPTDTSCTPFEHELAEPQDFVGDPSNSRNHRNFLNDIELRYAIDNSNTEGVNFGFGAATGNPQDVETGIEFSIPLSVIGATTDDIRVPAFVGSGPHNFVSNQFSGAGTPGGNLGSNYFSINLANITGDQFVTVPGGLPGDFNGDGSVDAADYTVWRDGLGGEYLAGDYQLWVDNFGATASAASTSVPEPTAALLLILAAGLAPSRRGSK